MWNDLNYHHQTTYLRLTLIRKENANALAQVALYKRSAPSHLVGNLATTSSLLSLFVRLFGLSLPGMHPQTDKKGQQKKLDYQPPN